MKGAPFTKKKDGKVRDRGGEVIDLFPGVREALLEVHRGHRFRGAKLAIASRTTHDRFVCSVYLCLCVCVRARRARECAGAATAI